MDETREYSIKDLINLMGKSFRLLLSKWPVLFAAGVIGALIGFMIAWYTPKTYSSRVSFILEEGKTSGGGLSAIAGQFGFDLGGMNGASNILAGDNILGLLKSKKFVRYTLLSPYDSQYSLADKYASVYGFHEKWKNDERINKIVYFPANNSIGFSRLQDSLLMVIENKAIKEIAVSRPDKKMTLFEVNASFRDELLSKYFAERLVNYTVEFYVETKTRRQRANVDRLQRRADSIAALLNRRTYSSAAIQSSLLDINPAYGTVAVPAEVSSRDKIMVGTIYGEIVKNLEIQKATLTQETPVIQIVDEAHLPLKINRKSRVVYLLVGAILCIMALSAILIIKRITLNK